MQTLKLFFLTLKSSLIGMSLTLRTFVRSLTKGTSTVQYPEQIKKIPENSRGLLYNDVEDCISCRQCVVVCPVNCITLEADRKADPKKADFTKGGVKKLFDLKKFNIDMSLCCYCGLCSEVCPTNCLYHTKKFDYVKFDRNDHIVDHMNFKI